MITAAVEQYMKPLENCGHTVVMVRLWFGTSVWSHTHRGVSSDVKRNQAIKLHSFSTENLADRKFKTASEQCCVSDLQ